MTLNDVLNELLNCLGIEDEYIVSWEQVQRWPLGAIQLLEKIGWLKKILIAKTVECHGCENRCFMPVQYKSGALEKSSIAFVSCDVRSDMGIIDIPTVRLQQWQLTQMQLAIWLNQKLKLKSTPSTNDEGLSIKLGAVRSDQKIAELHLDINHPISLKASGHSLPLSEVIYVKGSTVKLDYSAIFALINLPIATNNKNKASITKRKTPTDNMSNVGSPEWRKGNAQKAANARHSKPGGSHDKQKLIRDLWATGKYTSRDICAEQECAGLGMSFSTARKALINTPDPAT